MGVCGGNELLSVLCYSNAGMNDCFLKKSLLPLRIYKSRYFSNETVTVTVTPDQTKRTALESTSRVFTYTKELLKFVKIVPSSGERGAAHTQRTGSQPRSSVISAGRIVPRPNCLWCRLSARSSCFD